VCYTTFIELLILKYPCISRMTPTWS
jgi:hypothetical protein